VKQQVSLGFDGSLNNDWTALRAETIDGWQFTPRYGPDRRPTIWDPAQWNGEIPRGEVRAAVDELFSTYDVERSYWDPEDWDTEIDNFALAYGETKVVVWRTNRVSAMYEAIRRTETDLITGALTHDGCPITAVHVANARKVAKPGQKYVLGKPSETQKIDAAMASILAHEAAADARAAGWGTNRSGLTRVTGRVRGY
jgi:phage terminase large subunit-like protein